MLKAVLQEGYNKPRQVNIVSMKEVVEEMFEIIYYKATLDTGEVVDITTISEYKDGVLYCSTSENW
jgi:hypothetical protein